jgi:hypothetical protein
MLCHLVLDTADVVAVSAGQVLVEIFGLWVGVLLDLLNLLVKVLSHELLVILELLLLGPAIV